MAAVSVLFILTTVLAQAVPLREQLGAIDIVFVVWWAAICLTITLLVWSVLDRHIQRTQAVRDRMSSFGEMFIKEFEQPLASFGGAGRPIRSRVRCMPHRRQVDILIAPVSGRHYPNLSDHKKNVEYDVERIEQRLCDESFVSGRLHAKGPWVVIPFKFKPIIQRKVPCEDSPAELGRWRRQHPAVGQDPVPSRSEARPRY
jgi:hypothetical protein